MAGLPYLVKHKTGYSCNSVFHNTNPALRCLHSVMATVSKCTEPYLPVSANQNMHCSSIGLDPQSNADYRLFCVLDDV